MRPRTPPLAILPFVLIGLAWGGRPAAAQDELAPASRRVCPSPLFGPVLYGASGPRCVSDEHTLFPGWRFDAKTDYVCAKCTPNCVFTEVAAGRLICAVAGVPGGDPGTPPAGPPGPGTPPPSPSPGAFDLSGTWRQDPPGPDSTTLTGGRSGYTIVGTNGRYKNEGTLRGDGVKFEGFSRDVPGFCCGRDGYFWLEAIDPNTFRARSVWWTPGRSSRERPDITHGWSTWKRGGAGAAVAPASVPAQQDLSARKKALGEELSRVRLAGQWSPDHHYQVGTLIGLARTPAILDVTETLMREYAACYAQRNGDRETVQANARAGMYATPGQRIGELNRIAKVFDSCIGQAAGKFEAARRAGR